MGVIVALSKSDFSGDEVRCRNLGTEMHQWGERAREILALVADGVELIRITAIRCSSKSFQRIEAVEETESGLDDY